MSTAPANSPKRLEDHDDLWWSDKIPRLMAYADGKIRERRWLGLRGGDPPAGNEAHDIVSTVLRKVFDGTRVWNLEKYPKLDEFLRAQVDSEISYLVRKPENKRTSRIKSPGADEPGRKSIETTPSPTETPEHAAESAAAEKDFDRRLWAFIDSLHDDPDLQDLVIVASDGAIKRRELAAALKVDETEIDNRKKRLKRRRREYERREDL